MWLYLLGMLFFLTAYFLYTWVVRTKKRMARYVKLFREHGYKVVELPYVAYSAYFYDQLF
jgi:hypothetical protein